MARAIRLLVLFAFATLLLHYIGPAMRLIVNGTPEVLRILAAWGTAVQVPF